jgi:hypothetical protein
VRREERIERAVNEAFPNAVFFLVAPSALYDWIKKVAALHLLQWLAEATYVLEERRWSMLKKEKGEKIKVRHNKNKKFLCKLQVIVCII